MWGTGGLWGGADLSQHLLAASCCTVGQGHPSHPPVEPPQLWRSHVTSALVRCGCPLWCHKPAVQSAHIKTDSIHLTDFPDLFIFFLVNTYIRTYFKSHSTLFFICYSVFTLNTSVLWTKHRSFQGNCRFYNINQWNIQQIKLEILQILEELTERVTVTRWRGERLLRRSALTFLCDYNVKWVLLHLNEGEVCAWSLCFTQRSWSTTGGQVQETWQQSALSDTESKDGLKSQ